MDIPDTLVDKLLQTYSLEELLELSDKTEEDTVEFLLRHEFINIPDPEPV